MRRLLADRSSQVAGVSLAAVFVIAIVLPFDDTSSTIPASTAVGVLACLGIAAGTAIYIGAVTRLTVLAAAAFAAAAIAAYMLGNAIDWQFHLRGVGWKDHEDSGRLLGYNLGDLMGRLLLCAMLAVPLGAAFGAVGRVGAWLFRHGERAQAR